MGSRIGACWWCGLNGPVQDGHVVPRNLFPKGERPANLITLPECANCNQGSSNDEEYFLFALLAEGSIDSAAANRILDQAAHSKRDRQKLAQRFLRMTSGTRVLVPGISGRVELEVDRINRVLRRMVAGLYRHEFEVRLPRPEKTYVEIKPGTDITAHPVYRAVLQEPEHQSGQGVLSYSVKRSSDKKRSAWLLKFYGAVEAFAHTEEG